MAPRAASLSAPALPICWAGGLGVTIRPLASVLADAGDQRESFREGGEWALDPPRADMRRRGGGAPVVEVGAGCREPAAAVRAGEFAGRAEQLCRAGS